MFETSVPEDRTPGAAVPGGEDAAAVIAPGSRAQPSPDAIVASAGAGATTATAERRPAVHREALRRDLSFVTILPSGLSPCRPLA